MRQLDWPIGDLEEQIKRIWPDFSASVVEETDSTSTQLLARVRQGDVAPYLLIAESQTQARGRQGRTWFSRAEDTLMFSLLVPCPENVAQGMALVVGCSLVQALDPEGHTLKVKWPNDVCYRLPNQATSSWRKLAGILIETANYENRRYAVVGVGVNINPPPIEGHYNVHAGYLAEFDAKAHATTALCAIIPFLAQALYNFSQTGLNPWYSFFKQRDLLAGQMLTTSDNRQQGVGMGIDSNGNYLLETADKNILTLHSAEVSIRPC